MGGGEGGRDRGHEEERQKRCQGGRVSSWTLTSFLTSQCNLKTKGDGRWYFDFNVLFTAQGHIRMTRGLGAGRERGESQGRWGGRGLSRKKRASEDGREGEERQRQWGKGEGESKREREKREGKGEREERGRGREKKERAKEREKRGGEGERKKRGQRRERREGVGERKKHEIGQRREIFF